MDSAKLKAVANWPSPQYVKDVQQFLDFANFYCRYIPLYFIIATSLSCLMYKDVRFQWLDKEKATFLQIKE
jgi:hypothetical protein